MKHTIVRGLSSDHKSFISQYTTVSIDEALIAVE